MPLAIDPRLVDDARTQAPALERLVGEVWPDAYRIALSLLHDRGLAEDAAQDACASIARSLPSLKDARLFRPWAYKIVANHAVSTARRHPATEPLDAAAMRPDGDDAAARLDLQLALASLPLSQRAAIVLHYYAGLTSAEIASALHSNAATVRFHLMLGRRALRVALRLAHSPAREVLSDVR